MKQKKLQPNEDKFLEIRQMYDYLKTSYLIQCKELFKLKKENEQLHRQLSSFNSLTTSLTQNTISKYEMKGLMEDIIKEGLSPIISILQGQETEITQTKRELANALTEVKNEQLKQSMILQTEINKKEKQTRRNDDYYDEDGDDGDNYYRNSNSNSNKPKQRMSSKREEPRYEDEIKPRESFQQVIKKMDPDDNIISDIPRYSVQQSFIKKEEPKFEFKKVYHEKIQPNEMSKSTLNTEEKNKIKEILISQELDTTLEGIVSLIETEDKRIASGGEDGNISISSYDINTKTWIRDIHRVNAHDGESIRSLCTLPGDRLVSAGGTSIKVWGVSKTLLKPIKQIFEHKCTVCKVIPLSNNRLASCARDKTVRVIKDDKKFTLLATLPHDNYVNSIIQLKKKEILVSCGMFSNTGISFWNLTKFSNMNTIKGYGVSHPTHMIELSNGNVALSVKKESTYPIVIVDSVNYRVIKEIVLTQKITQNSSLCVCDQRSFVYVYNGTFLQISNEDFKVMYEGTEGNFDGVNGVIPLGGKKCFAVLNGKCVTIVQPENDMRKSLFGIFN